MNRARRLAQRLLPVALIVGWIVAIARTGRWPSGDGPHLLGTSMRLSQLLRDLHLLDFARDAWSLLGPHPPLAYLPSTLSYTLLGTHLPWVHLFAAGLVLWLIQDGLRRLGGGLVGSLLLAASGLVWAQAEGYGVDLLAGAAVLQSLSHLVASERLSRPRHVWAWGLWMGVAFLTKYTAPLFLWAPTLVAGWWALRHRRYKPVLGAVVAFSMVALPWYLLHLRGVLGYIQVSGDAGSEVLTNRALVTGPWWSWHNLSWYLSVLLDAWGWPVALAVAIGALWTRRPGLRPGAWAVPLLGAMGGWLMLATQVQRQDRYLLPAMMLLAAAAAASRLRWGIAPLALLGAWFTGSMFTLSGRVPSNRDFSHQWAGAGRDWPWPAVAFRPVDSAPDRWKVDEAVARLRQAQGADTGTVGLLLDETGGGPGYGLILSRSAAQGYRWDLATVMWQPRLAQAEPAPLPGDPTVFVGPFVEGVSKDFDAMLVIMNRDDTARDRWLQHTGMVEQARWELPNGYLGRVLRR